MLFAILDCRVQYCNRLNSSQNTKSLLYKLFNENFFETALFYCLFCSKRKTNESQTKANQRIKESSLKYRLLDNGQKTKIPF